MKSYTPLLTDLYQLTMAYGYWCKQMHNLSANFYLSFRRHPFNGNYALSAGLGNVVEFLAGWQFAADDLAYLASLKNSEEGRLFPNEFLDYLATLKFTGDLYAIPEGTIVFAHEPLLRLEGPLLQCQLLESALLNIINFQTLIATKSARVCYAAKGAPVIEFGLRRAQGPDGALSATRAAFIGGCVGTSNVLAGKLYHIPVRGTHAHSWVTSFSSELAAFTAYADVLPHHCVLLVDTYHTLQGVKNAIKVGKQLREAGGELLAIRLDSGDMVELSIQARKLLDEAGFNKTGILASNSLDEYTIAELKQAGAQISSWGVGTHLVTAYDQPALDGVYKLSALQDPHGKWAYKLKLSEESAKTSVPGRHQVRRFFSAEQYVMDVIYDLSLKISDTARAYLFDPPHQFKRLDDIDGFVDLLIPVYQQGKCVLPPENLSHIRERAMEATAQFYAAHGECNHYPVGLEESLHQLKQQLIVAL